MAFLSTFTGEKIFGIMNNYLCTIFMIDKLEKAKKDLEKAKAAKKKAPQDELKALQKRSEGTQGDKEKKEQELKQLDNE
jgi:hypothetical protein